MWTDEMFGVKKPIIAMLHLRALPGDPLYEDGTGIDRVAELASEELLALQEGGVDGILIANEFSLPYEKQISPVALASFAYIVGRIRADIVLPFGVNIAHNAIETIDLAAATGAQFVRNAFTGAYAGEYGIVDTDVSAALRRKKYLGLKDLKLFFKANPEGDVFIADKPIEAVTKSIVFSCAPDALCASGSSAGSETDSEIIKRIKSAAGSVPVFANTGCTMENIAEKLSICDGAVVGTAFKEDGRFAGRADARRVKEFMDVVKDYRRTL
ncbi:MAG: BtpA/SgcQ family protein [Firmicutes bacterium]|nr:BtpA/SgcQ family protein [Bacillota bacterium]